MSTTGSDVIFETVAVSALIWREVTPLSAHSFAFSVCTRRRSLEQVYCHGFCHRALFIPTPPRFCFAFSSRRILFVHQVLHHICAFQCGSIVVAVRLALEFTACVFALFCAPFPLRLSTVFGPSWAVLLGLGASATLWWPTSLPASKSTSFKNDPAAASSVPAAFEYHSCNTNERPATHRRHVSAHYFTARSVAFPRVLNIQ